MKRSKRLTSVANLMAHREQEAARRLTLSRKQLEQQYRRLQELLAYQTEYQRSFQQTMKLGMDASSMHEYQRFLHQLNQAIQQQQQSVETADQEHKSSRQNWLDRHCLTKAVNQVADRCRGEENYAQSRREQKENDDCLHHLSGPERD